MHGLSVLVSAGPPGVIPQAAPVALLLEAGHLGHLPPLPGELGRPAHEGHPGGARPDHADLLVWHLAKAETEIFLVYHFVKFYVEIK